MSFSEGNDSSFMDPFSMSAGEAVFGGKPSSNELTDFAESHSQAVMRLTLELDEVDQDMSNPVDLSLLGTMPLLTHLSLGRVMVKELRLNEGNLPNLRQLSLSKVNMCHTGGVELHLSLPNLQELKVEFTRLVGKPNSFGQSVSRCPSLRTITAYKFASFAGYNYMILPSCTFMRLVRCDDTRSLEILSAPKLASLDINNSNQLSHVRLYDFLDVSLADVEQLNNGEMKLGALLKRNRPDVLGVQGQKRNSLGQPKTPVVKNQNLPRCTVRAANMGLDRATLKHLNGNKRISVLK